MTILDRIKAHHPTADPEQVGVKAVVADELSAKQDGKTVLVTAIANTAAIDLVDEVVVPSGCVMSNGQPAYLMEAKAVYLNHDYEELPVGTMRNARLSGDRWVCQMAIHDRTELARDLQGLLMMGDECPVRGVSIGFQRRSYGAPTKEEIAQYGPHAYITREWLFMELSVTPQPCNPEAWITSVGGKSVPKIDDATAGRLDDLARKGVIRKSTAEALGLVVPKRRKRLLIIED